MPSFFALRDKTFPSADFCSCLMTGRYRTRFEGRPFPAVVLIREICGEIFEFLPAVCSPEESNRRTGRLAPCRYKQEE
jgi:hypothetical protein